MDDWLVNPLGWYQLQYQSLSHQRDPRLNNTTQRKSIGILEMYLVFQQNYHACSNEKILIYTLIKQYWKSALRNAQSVVSETYLALVSLYERALFKVTHLPGDRKYVLHFIRFNVVQFTWMFCVSFGCVLQFLVHDVKMRAAELKLTLYVMQRRFEVHSKVEKLKQH
jgi:hypothetical protein